MATTAWKKKHASLIVFGIVLIGSLFAFSTAKEEAVKSGTVIGIDLGTTDSCVGVYKNGHVEFIANDQGNKITTSYEEAVKLGTVIGIDLGTTYSCVGVYKNGLVEIITDDQGNKITPSWVGFTDSEILIGEAAKNQSAVNPERTIFDVKRLIGRKFEDKEVQRVMKIVPYKVVNKDGKPYIQIKVKDGEIRVFSPEEISAMILTKMKETAEAYLGKEIKDVVITVPAYFNEAQKQATKDAGIIAGLNVARIIDEPTAAAIAYGLDRQQQKNILVIDLGGGTFDVSILTTEYGVLEVLSTNGDTHLGGPLTRAPRFEELNNDDLFKKTILGLVNKAMEDAGLEKDEIDEIVLVGGGKNTMIPKVEELLKNYFNGKQPRKCLNPDEAVAIGAAVQGGILSGDVLDPFSDVGLGPPMYPLPTLGIETVGGVMSKLIDRNTVIPTKISQVFTTCQDRQTTVSIKVYEVYEGGHSQVLTKDCRLLGTFNLSGIPPAPRGTPRIEVTFSVDVDGILNVKAKDKASGKSENITITGGLSEEEINRMIHEAEEFAEEDRKLKEKIDSRNTLETYIYNMRSQINDKDKLANKLETDEKARIENATKEALEWIDDNQGVEKEEYVEKLKEVEGVCNPIVTSVYQRSVRGESSFARRVVDFFIFIIILFYYYSLFYYDN